MRCGWPSKNYETSNDGRPVHAPRRGLAEISAIPPLLAGLDESVFAAPPEVAPQPVPGNADLRSRRDETGLGESGKVAGVVDAMDGGKSAAVPPDLVNAGGAEIQPVKGAKRDAEGPAQQDLYRGNVTYHQDSLAAVVPQ